jgi:hypothetical protein
MKTLLTLSILLLLATTANSQSLNPFESIGKKGEIITLSNGKYVEVYSNDSLQKIGSVVMNMNTGEVYEFLQIDTVYSEATLDPTIISRWYSIDPLASKYPGISPYAFVANMPIVAIDPDGRDIIVLSDKQAAGRAGHQAILIGNNKDGWTYISKDGSPDGKTSAAGKPIFVVQKFNTIEDFRNSPHNFELADDQHHSTIKGVTNSNLTYKLDENGNKIQRYDEAFYIGTTQVDGSSTDAVSIDAASKSAAGFYCLTNGDCSDVVTAALSVGKNSKGQKLKTGEDGMAGGLAGEIPRVKQAKIESRNKGIDYDAGIKPDNLKLQSGEKGKKED